MFEKEAEDKGVEYADKQKRIISIHEDSGYSWGQVEEGYENGFKDGANFGYNKANEWHYVKDGDLPKHENYVLVSNGKDWTKGFYKDKKWNVISLVGFSNIIAWKEIVLPELKESE